VTAHRRGSERIACNLQTHGRERLARGAAREPEQPFALVRPVVAGRVEGAETSLLLKLIEHRAIACTNRKATMFALLSAHRR
jgi:hypothetical protein